LRPSAKGRQWDFKKLVIYQGFPLRSSYDKRELLARDQYLIIDLMHCTKPFATINRSKTVGFSKVGDISGFPLDQSCDKETTARANT
jgi:hypothetical protein